MDELTSHDLKAAVNANIINERQLSDLIHLAQNRNLSLQTKADDEPVTIFTGFSEIFITVGLCILFMGTYGALTITEGALASIISIPVSFAFSHYFIVKRRLMLPSIASLCILSFSLTTFFLYILAQTDLFPTAYAGMLFLCLCTLLSSVGFAEMFRRYKFPFLVFISGVFCLKALVFASIAIEGQTLSLARFSEDLTSPLTIVFVLLFGLATLALGIYYDSTDPYRIKNASKTAFWLHILSAPCLLNAAAYILYDGQTFISYALTALVLLLFAAIALLIDRRSFITAGLIYTGLLVHWAITELSAETNTFFSTLFILGLFTTALATWWNKCRYTLMTALPAFPGKEKLPPYK